MNHLADHRNRQNRAKAIRSELSCPLCKQQQRESDLADENAFYTHLDLQHGDEIAKSRQDNPDFDVQVWKVRLKSLATKRYHTWFTLMPNTW